MPRINNGTRSYIRDCTAVGFGTGFMFSEFAGPDCCWAVCCNVGYEVKTSFAGMNADRTSAMLCRTNLLITDSGFSGSYAYVNWRMFCYEYASGALPAWMWNQYDVVDLTAGGPKLLGSIYMIGNQGGNPLWTLNTLPTSFPNADLRIGTLGMATLNAYGAQNVQFLFASTNPPAVGTAMMFNGSRFYWGAQAATITPSAQITLTPSSATNYLLDFSATNSANLNWFINATNNVYLTQPTNLVAGKAGALWMLQDATGSRTFNCNTSYWKFPGGIVPIATTNAGGYDLFSFQVLPYGSNVAGVCSPNFK